MQNALFNLLDGFDLPGESASLTVRFRDARNESSPSVADVTALVYLRADAERV
jgi:hypothetical protein